MGHRQIDFRPIRKRAPSAGTEIEERASELNLPKTNDVLFIIFTKSCHCYILNGRWAMARCDDAARHSLQPVYRRLMLATQNGNREMKFITRTQRQWRQRRRRHQTRFGSPLFPFNCYRTSDKRLVLGPLFLRARLLPTILMFRK